MINPFPIETAAPRYGWAPGYGNQTETLVQVNVRIGQYPEWNPPLCVQVSF